MVISIGLISALTRTLVGLSPFSSISDCERSRESPVSLRSRAARRRRMLGVDVSGTRMNITTKMGAAIQTISHRDQRQPLA